MQNNLQNRSNIKLGYYRLLKHNANRLNDLIGYNYQICRQKAHQHNYREHTDFSGYFLRLCFQLSKFHLFEVVRKHLKIHLSVIATDYGYESSHNIGKLRRINSRLHSHQRHLVSARTHIRAGNSKLISKCRSSILFEPFQN